MCASRWWWGVLWLLAAPVAWAGQYVLLAGQTNTVPVSARVLNGEQVCNLLITLPGQVTFEAQVRAPFFDTRVTLTPFAEETVTVHWRGQFRRGPDGAVNACPTEGQAQFKVVPNIDLTRAVWTGMMAQLPPAKVDCLRAALAYDQVRPESFDFTDPQISAEDAKIQRAFVQCDAFLGQKKAWGSQNPQSHACTVAGVQTRCEGFFSAHLNGKSQVISKDVAIQRQLQGLPWTTGVREIAAVRSARIQQEKDRVAQLAAEEAAKLQAIEDARLLALKQAEDAKAAEQKALQEKIAALRAQIEEEKLRAEQERSWLFRQVDQITGSKPKTDAVGVSPAAPEGPNAGAGAKGQPVESVAPPATPASSAQPK